MAFFPFPDFRPRPDIRKPAHFVRFPAPYGANFAHMWGGGSIPSRLEHQENSFFHASISNLFS
jgi:hypothetical protein